MSLYELVSWTGRASALLFALALLLPLSRSGARASRWVYASFLLLHAVHFAVLAAFAQQYPHVPLFPGARTLTDAGGWPAFAGIVLLFFTLARLGFPTAPAAPERASVPRHVGLTLIALMFLATYLPLISRSPWFGLPPLLISAGLVATLIRPRLRALCCFA